MENSSFNKLPLNFILVCGLGVLGVGIAWLNSGFFSEAVDQQSSVASAPPVAGTTTDANRNSSTQSRTENGVGQIDRSNYHASREPVANVAQDAVAVEQETGGTENSSSVAVEVTETTQPDVSDLSNEEVTESVADEIDAKLAEKLFDIVDSVKATLVGVSSEQENSTSDSATPGEVYSPENPDPSQLIADALEKADGNDITEILDSADDVVILETPLAVETPASNEPNPESETAAISSTTEEDTSDILEPSEDDELRGATNTVQAEVVVGDLSASTQNEDAGQPAKPQEISISNPTHSPLPVAFVANRKKVRLEPGQVFLFPADQDLDVRFDRGGDFGGQHVRVVGGDWQFSVSRAAGWKLKQH